MIKNLRLSNKMKSPVYISQSILRITSSILGNMWNDQTAGKTLIGWLLIFGWETFILFVHMHHKCTPFPFIILI